MNKILVINAGSSTIKWKIFTESNLKVLAEGIADRIGIDGILRTKFNGNKKKKEVEMPNHIKAMDEILETMKLEKIIFDIDEITSIGHRVVQGGETFPESTILTFNSLAKIKEFSQLAPLHNPNAIRVIEACKKIWGDIHQTATFDTSFHTTIPAINSTYPIGQELAKELTIKKYGAHGTSHRYITQKLKEIQNKDNVTFINAHIGNGASLCAIKDSKSFDTSMGLTPLAGVMMGTRCGDIDPSIIKFIMEQKKMSIKEVDNFLNKESGMKGVSGISSDFRDIEQAILKGNKQAIFAFDLYCQRIVDTIATYANKLGNKLDAIVFTAGVGENDSNMRKNVVEKLKFDKIIMDDKLNTQSFEEWLEISTQDSNVKVYIIRTDEELLIAQDNKELK